MARAAVVLGLLACAALAAALVAGSPTDLSQEAETYWSEQVSGLGQLFESATMQLVVEMGIENVQGTLSNTFQTDADNNVPSDMVLEWWAGISTYLTSLFRQTFDSLPESPGTASFSGLVSMLQAEFTKTAEVAWASASDMGLSAGGFTLGGGAGAGLQVYDCKGTLLLDFGVGVGHGLTVAAGGQSVTGGYGGGGGLQLYKDGAPFFSAGGGGGGSLTCQTSSWTPATSSYSEDANELLPVQMYEALVVVAQSGCQPYTVSLGGGAGGGFDMAGPSPSHFGAGYGFGNGINPPAGGNATDPVLSIVNACTSQCSTAGQNYNTCFCPCFQAGALAAGYSWAASIQCSDD